MASKARARALGNVEIKEIALSGRCYWFRPCRALKNARYIPGLAPWALLLGPFRAISGIAALSGTQIRPPALPEASVYVSYSLKGGFFGFVVFLLCVGAVQFVSALQGLK